MSAAIRPYILCTHSRAVFDSVRVVDVYSSGGICVVSGRVEVDQKFFVDKRCEMFGNDYFVITQTYIKVILSYIIHARTIYTYIDSSVYAGRTRDP